MGPGPRFLALIRGRAMYGCAGSGDEAAVCCLGLRVWGLGLRVGGYRAWDSGLLVLGLGLRVQGTKALGWGSWALGWKMVKA